MTMSQYPFVAAALPAIAIDDHLMLRMEVGRQTDDGVEIHVLERVPTPIAQRFRQNAEAAGWVLNVKVADPKG